MTKQAQRVKIQRHLHSGNTMLQRSNNGLESSDFKILIIRRSSVFKTPRTSKIPRLEIPGIKGVPDAPSCGIENRIVGDWLLFQLTLYPEDQH